ncbi:MAG TPA: HEPN domain-containing protein [Saprospiraceae bacterium]|nr:HEPN domain-containing protein [Saprospiraceae bacterium]
MEGSREDYITYRLTKSEEAYADAALLFENERWNACVNRLYYSSYYTVSALLYSHQITAHTHNGIKTKFFLSFIKTNMIEREYGKLYSRLFDWRNESDYADFLDFDRNSVTPLLKSVSDFNTTLKMLIKH